MDKTMMEEYTKKVVEPKVKKEVKKELPIFKKRQHWCFKFEGGLYKFESKTDAEKKYLELVNE